MGTIDNQFQATGPGIFGFAASPKTSGYRPSEFLKATLRELWLNGI
jgi:hypothetical protein